MCSTMLFDHYHYCASFQDSKLNHANVAAVTSLHVGHIIAVDCWEVISFTGWPSLA
jgi:hypothetical protein